MTPTASGKTLCYALPDPAGHRRRPGVAGAPPVPDQGARPGPGDRVRRARRRRPGCTVSASTYDGDTPAPIRSAIRSAGQVVATNPDMLHSAILPHHTKWFQLFEQLRYIVIDELHTYRGVFGGHVANVLRRLLRICAHYGSHPVIVCCSATIGNPGELAEALIGRPVRRHRPERRAGRRAPRPAGRPAAPRPGERGPRLGGDARPALGPAVPAGRPPDDRVRAVAGRRRAAADRAARVAARELRAAQSRVRGYRGGYLPTERRAIERGLRDGEILGRRRHQRARARRRHRPARRVDPGRLSGLDRRDLAAVRAGRPAARARASRSSSRRAPRSTSTSSTTRSSCSRARPRRRAPTRTTSTSCSPTCAPRRSSCRSSPARCSGPARPTTCWRSSPRRATSARRATGAGTGRARTSRPRRSRCGPPRRRTSSSSTRRPDRPRVLGEVDLFSRPGPRPRARDLHPRVGPVPRRQARLGRAQGLRPQDRRRPLHVRQPGGDAQAARRLRRGAGDRRPAGPRRGHGRQPRHALQEAQVPDRRERRLGPDRPARARAPDDRLLADGRGRHAVAGDATSSTSRCPAPGARSRRWRACC